MNNQNALKILLDNVDKLPDNFSDDILLKKPINNEDNVHLFLNLFKEEDSLEKDEL